MPSSDSGPTTHLLPDYFRCSFPIRPPFTNLQTHLPNQQFSSLSNASALPSLKPPKWVSPTVRTISSPSHSGLLDVFPSTPPSHALRRPKNARRRKNTRKSHKELNEAAASHRRGVSTMLTFSIQTSSPPPALSTPSTACSPAPTASARTPSSRATASLPLPSRTSLVRARAGTSTSRRLAVLARVSASPLVSFEHFSLSPKFQKKKIKDGSLTHELTLDGNKKSPCSSPTKTLASSSRALPTPSVSSCLASSRSRVTS